MPDFSKFTIPDAIAYLEKATRKSEEKRKPQSGGEAAIFTLLTWHTPNGTLIGDAEFWKGPLAVQSRVTLYSPIAGEVPRTFTGEAAALIRNSGETWGGQYGISQLGV